MIIVVKKEEVRNIIAEYVANKFKMTATKAIIHTFGNYLDCIEVELEDKERKNVN